MSKKFVIALLSIFLLSFNAIAASDGELVLSENEKPKKIKVRNIIEISISQGYDSILNNLKCCTIFICYLSL